MLRTALALCVFCCVSANAESKPLFQSKIITSKTDRHSVDIDVGLRGAKDLFLVVTDGGNGFSCDWADWAEPKLVGAKGELKLTDLKWSAASSGWGQVRKNRNAGGGEMSIAGEPVEYGIGTHANSIVHFKVPAGYTRFKARGGLDNGGTNQGDGTATSVQFLVFNEEPPARLFNAGRSQDIGNRDAADAVGGLDVPDDLEVSLFASEPLMLSPSNMDVDHLGRVWICEVVNYRHFRNRNNRRESRAIEFWFWKTRISMAKLIRRRRFIRDVISIRLTEFACLETKSSFRRATACSS